VVIDQLANGVHYTFTVKAMSSTAVNMWGPASAPSNAIIFGTTESTLPGSPTGVVATIDQAAPGVATVSWTPPVSDGGAFIRTYRVEASPGGQEVEVERDITTTSFTGLANNIAYTFRVRAVNDVGPSTPSDPSNPVMFGDGSGTPATPPDPPTDVVAAPGDGQATISWVAPANNGGSPITGYRIVGRGTPDQVVAGPSDSSAVFPGLTNGNTYKFKIFAVSMAGESVASAFSNDVTPSSSGGPATLPGAPTNVQAVASPGKVTVTWTAPGDGGSPIVKYWVSSQPGNLPLQVSAPSTKVEFTNLKSGISYTFKVAAVNSVGRGADSAVSGPVTAQAPAAVIAKGMVLGINAKGDLYRYLTTGTENLKYPPARIGGGWKGYTLVSAGDLNGDGKGDLLARTPGGDLMLYRGTGTGGLAYPPSRLGGGWNVMTSMLSPGDLNSDGKADLLARKTNGDLMYYKGTGTGNLVYPPSRLGGGWNTMNQLFSTGDFNSDGKADLLARKTNGDLMYYKGTGPGNLVYPPSRLGGGWSIYGSLSGVR
jgi:hypothetical protein